MQSRLEEIVAHDNTDECVACRSRDFTAEVIIPAVAAWEASAELPRFALSLHGAAALLGGMIADGFNRDQIEAALGRLLDDVEAEIEEDKVLGGPTQGTA